MELRLPQIGRKVLSLTADTHGTIVGRGTDLNGFIDCQVILQLENGSPVFTVASNGTPEGYALLPPDGNEASRPSVRNPCNISNHEFQRETGGPVAPGVCKHCGLHYALLEGFVQPADEMYKQYRYEEPNFDSVKQVGYTPPEPPSADEVNASDDAYLELVREHNREYNWRRRPLSKLIPETYEAEGDIPRMIRMFHPDADVRFYPSPMSEKVSVFIRGIDASSVKQYDHERHPPLRPRFVIVDTGTGDPPMKAVVDNLKQERYTPLDGSEPDFGDDGWPASPSASTPRNDIVGSYVFLYTLI